MCYVGIKKSEKIPIIAKEDIIVVKKLFRDCNKLYSYHKRYDYTNKKGIVLPKVTIIPDKYNHGVIAINKGYHSYREKYVNRMCLDRYFYRDVFCLFMIPKGTKYYQCDNFIVSETIVFIGEI